MNANALEEELEFVDGVVHEELVEVVGEVERGEGRSAESGLVVACFFFFLFFLFSLGNFRIK